MTTPTQSPPARQQQCQRQRLRQRQRQRQWQRHRQAATRIRRHTSAVVVRLTPKTPALSNSRHVQGSSQPGAAAHAQELIDTSGDAYILDNGRALPLWQQQHALVYLTASLWQQQHLVDLTAETSDDDDSLLLARRATAARHSALASEKIRRTPATTTNNRQHNNNKSSQHKQID